jgi:CheY-like chemotaxis protein
LMIQKTVLVIEDDRSLARLTEIVFTGKGFNTHICLDATNALEMSRRVRPDLIILDIHMPRRSGMWILKRLKQDEFTCEIPVIVYSVLARKQSIEQLKKIGAGDFIPKSAGMDALVRKALTYLEPDFR